MEIYEKLQSCLSSVRAKTDFEPRIALILGSGLGEYGDKVRITATIDYSEIEGFPISTAPGHRGRFIFGHVGEIPVVVMQGRVHYYEGYPMSDVVLPTRLMGLMGVKALMLTNAAGGANFSFSAGDLMLIRDHITSFVPSPLIGKNIDQLGVRFPDMSRVYDAELCDIIRSTAARCGVPLKEGVYLQLTGPNFETPAEVRMYRMLGGDALGMSTAVEAMAARHMGIRVCGVSCISNLACGMTSSLLSSEDVNETAAQVEKEFSMLVTESIKAIGAIL